MLKAFVFSVAVCGSNGSVTEPRETAQMNQMLAHQAVFHEHSTGAPLSSPLLKCRREFTREPQVRGISKGHSAYIAEMNSTLPPGGARVSGRAAGVPGSAWHFTSHPPAAVGARPTLLSPLTRYQTHQAPPPTPDFRVPCPRTAVPAPPTTHAPHVCVAHPPPSR